MKNKLIGIILVMVLLLPVSVRAVDNNMPAEAPATEEIAEPATAEPSDNISQLDEDAAQPEAVQQAPVIPHKEPISKRKLVKMFLKAMIAVGISCVVLYVGLSAYNKIRSAVTGNPAAPNKGSVPETTLSTPTDFESAIKKFLEKTNWG